MPDPISWYALGRAVDDPETILEAVDASILSHNLDPSAHGQESEGIYQHRVAPLLDHLNYVIYNNKLNPAARTVIAICDSGGRGDFRTVQEAIDYANLYGGGTVHVKAGTYTLTADITLYSNITLEGDDDDTTILDFGDGERNLRIVGTSGTHKRNITIKNLQITRAAKTDEGAIHISYADDVQILDCYFTNNNYAASAPNADITAEFSCFGIVIERCYFELSNRCLSFTAQTNVRVQQNTFVGQDSTNEIIYIGNTVDLVIEDNYFNETLYSTIYTDAAPVHLVIKSNFFYADTSDESGPVINISGADGVLIEGNTLEGNSIAADAIQLAEGANYCRVINNYIRNFTGHGIIVNASDYNIIANNVSRSNDYGVRIYGATSDANIVLGNELRLNSTANLSDTGTSTVISANVAP